MDQRDVIILGPSISHQQLWRLRPSLLNANAPCSDNRDCLPGWRCLPTNSPSLFGLPPLLAFRRRFTLTGPLKVFAPGYNFRQRAECVPPVVQQSLNVQSAVKENVLLMPSPNAHIRTNPVVQSAIREDVLLAPTFGGPSIPSLWEKPVINSDSSNVLAAPRISCGEAEVTIPFGVQETVNLTILFSGGHDVSAHATLRETQSGQTVSLVVLRRSPV